jgi:hypothetical protein
MSQSDRTTTAIGLCLLLTAVVLSFGFVIETEQQALVARAILALGAAGIVQGFSGFLELSSRSRLYLVRAGGPLAVALGIYTVDPPPPMPRPDGVGEPLDRTGANLEKPESPRDRRRGDSGARPRGVRLLRVLAGCPAKSDPRAAPELR